MTAAPTVTLYGIANCDTVKRARAWLAERGYSVAFHDFKQHGVPLAELDLWLATFGWERVLNRQGSTWRQLGDTAQRAVVDAAGARQVMLDLPSVIKRPLMRWGAGGPLTLGFTKHFVAPA